MINLIISETKILWKEILLYIIVLTIICSISVSLFSFSINAKEHINDTINQYSLGIPFEISISNPDDKTELLLNEIEFNDYNYSFFHESRILSHVNIESLRGELLINGKTASNNNLTETEIIISKKVSQILNLSIGDSVILDFPSKEKACFTIKQINDYDGIDFKLSLNYVKNRLQKNGYSEKYLIIGDIYNFDKCKKAIRILKSKGYNINCPLYECIDNRIGTLYQLCLGFGGLSVVLCINMTGIYVSFFNIIFMSRQNYIHTLTLIGSNKLFIIKLYFAILVLIQLSVSTICYPLSSTITNWIKAEYNATFEFNRLSNHFNPLYSIAIFTIMSLMLLLSMINFDSRLKKLMFKKQ